MSVCIYTTVPDKKSIWITVANMCLCIKPWYRNALQLDPDKIMFIFQTDMLIKPEAMEAVSAAICYYHHELNNLYLDMTVSYNL